MPNSVKQWAILWFNSGECEAICTKSNSAPLPYQRVSVWIIWLCNFLASWRILSLAMLLLPSYTGLIYSMFCILSAYLLHMSLTQNTSQLFPVTVMAIGAITLSVFLFLHLSVSLVDLDFNVNCTFKPDLNNQPHLPHTGYKITIFLTPSWPGRLFQGAEDTVSGEHAWGAVGFSPAVRQPLCVWGPLRLWAQLQHLLPQQEGPAAALAAVPERWACW